MQRIELAILALFGRLFSATLLAATIAAIESPGQDGRAM
jgi:hypothetical protein